MNEEITKAINKKEKKHPIRQWWNKNDYKVFRIIFFPIWFAKIGKEKINKRLNAREIWSDERAKEIFDYYVPRSSEWDEEEKIFYFFDNGCGWDIHFAKKFLKRKDRRFWTVYTVFFGGQLKKYLINDYELEGFQKCLGDCGKDWTKISFKLIEK